MILLCHSTLLCHWPTSARCGERSLAARWGKSGGQEVWRSGGVWERGERRQTGSRSMLENRERRCSTALVWIWQTRDSVTPSTLPISCSVRFS